MGKITERTYFALEIVLASPICVSSGEDVFSDSDVLRNGNGELFIPGTSIAGAFRNYLMLDKKQSGMMGYTNGENGKMSSLFVSDLFLKDGKTSIRDFVALSEEKQVDNKFDMEIIETGAKGALFFNYVKREEDTEDFDSQICRLISGIKSGYIRFGSKKNRGFGRLYIEKVYEKRFTEANVDAWITFAERDLEGYSEWCAYAEWEKKREECAHESAYIKLSVPLKLTGGISIRKYATKPNEADYEQLTCNELPVIPGSSWSGVFRTGAESILKELTSKETVKEYIDAWFGHVDKKNAWQSKVIISESWIRGGNNMVATRNKINRFDASTKQGALYTERSHFGGTTTLELMVRKDEAGEYKSILGLLLLVIGEICRGALAVGGLVAIGRGILFDNGPITYEGHGSETEAEWNTALAHWLKGEH